MKKPNLSESKQGFSSDQKPHDAANEQKASFDPEVTVANKRIRRERGELCVGDMVLGRYELLGKLGSGAMGVVFKCRDQLSKVEYALKMVPPELACDADAMEDVRENFQLIHGLKHPNIASTDFLDRDEFGAYFLLMEYAPGITLSQWIKQKWRDGSPDRNEVVKIIRQVSSALDYAHRKHILHRDVKPTNVMVDEHGEVKVLDFGLASKVHNTRTSMALTTDMTSGTPCFLSPEQFKGRYPTPAADQYALGVLAYQMLAGHLPFESDDYNVLRSAVVNEQPEPIPGVSDSTNQCIQKTLSKDPKSRYSTCMEFAENLTRALAEQPARNDNKNKAISQKAPKHAEQSLPVREDRRPPAENKDGNRIRQTAFHRNAKSLFTAAVYLIFTSLFFWICFLWFTALILFFLTKDVLPQSTVANLTEQYEQIIIPFSLGFILLFMLLSFSAISVRKAMRKRSMILTILTLVGIASSVGILFPIAFYSWFPAGAVEKIGLFLPSFLCLFCPLAGTRDQAKEYLRKASIKPSFHGIPWLELFSMMRTEKDSALNNTAQR